MYLIDYTGNAPVTKTITLDFGIFGKVDMNITYTYVPNSVPTISNIT